MQELVNEKTHELNESQKFLSLILQTIPDAVHVKDKNLKVIRANDIFINYFPPEKQREIVGHQIIDGFPKGELRHFLEQDKAALKHGISQTSETITTYTGEVKNLLTTKVKFSDGNDNDYILSVSRDISELISIQKNLEVEVKERTKEYLRQKNLAEKAGNAKEEFLANMSHELRTPLNSIIGLTKIMSNDGGLNSEKTRMLNTIEKASDNLLQTVNEILDISKIESGNIELEDNSFNLARLQYAIVDQATPLANQKGIRIKHNLNSLSDVYIKGDEHRITSIIMNIVSNAIKYSNDGEVSILFNVTHLGDQKIQFNCAVSDTGIGIPEDRLESIFDKFSQAKKSTERLYGGTGLGLSIAKELVGLMSGKISVESEVGKGSRFEVIIPFSTSKKVTDGEHSDANSSGNDVADNNDSEKINIKDIHILVAEDHEFNQIFIDAFLNRLGSTNHKIVVNGAIAFNEYKTGRYDLILMDCNMPVMNGYEASQKIRAYENKHNIIKNKIIISAMTADVMAETRNSCLKAGMDEYLAKPLNESVFKNALGKWITFQASSDKNPAIIAPNTPPSKRIDLGLLIKYIGDNIEDQKELVSVFHESSLLDLDNLKKNCKTYNKEQWLISAHRLGGSSSYIGASNLKKLCLIAETSKLKTEAERSRIFQKIQHEHALVCQALNECALLDTE